MNRPAPAPSVATLQEVHLPRPGGGWAICRTIGEIDACLPTGRALLLPGHLGIERLDARGRLPVARMDWGSTAERLGYRVYHSQGGAVQQWVVGPNRVARG